MVRLEEEEGAGGISGKEPGDLWVVEIVAVEATVVVEERGVPGW